MNRRTVLGLAGASVTVGLAGCLDGVREHFGLQGVIPIEIHNEGEQSRNLHIQAREHETSRDSYEQSFTVTPGETVGPPHLDESEQSFRAAIIEDEEQATVRTASITPDTSLVVIRISDDDLVVEVQRDDGEDEIADGEDDDAVGETDVDETDDESDDAETAANETETETETDETDES